MGNEDPIHLRRLITNQDLTPFPPDPVPPSPRRTYARLRARTSRVERSPRSPIGSGNCSASRSTLEGIWDRDSLSEIVGGEARPFANARQHARADLFSIMEREHGIWPAGPRQHAVRRP